MKEYYFIVKTKNIAEFDGKSITIYQKSALGIKYITNLQYWKGEQIDLVDKLRAKINLNKSKLGKIILS